MSSSSSLLPHAVRASFWRGGTSKGIFLTLSDLPDWLQTSLASNVQSGTAQFRRMEAFFATIMGSPDPYGRQLNGMGGGISSLSKAMVVGPSNQPDADIDYTFFQIGINDGRLDMAGNCGNLTAAVGPFALYAGLYEKIPGSESQPHAVLESECITLRMRNTNTDKIIQSDFQACRVNGHWQYLELGNCSIDGVPGTGSTITLSFLDPSGSKTGTALPTGNPIDEIEVGNHVIQASLIDVSNPGIFVDGSEIGWRANASPEELNVDQALLDKLETIRRTGAEMMGLDPNISSIPKIVLLFPTTTEDGGDLACQALSMEQAHKAVPVTLALNLGVACKMHGTIPAKLSRHLHPSNTVISHPSGTLEVGASIEYGEVHSAKLIRTARCHMDGFVNILRAEEDEVS
ncbi:hypothetical protein A1O1_04964 [Capronia coronata CBS 617.96]|uniref:Uncharacterized protein n=1 Tax=Capronia coronata CBS 617.96 TaxID=1182541 RepID=W9Y5D9_9EURO|nr:uncharacterized protein A1O1_04964 [Capronia coronata CBS 617.96]EXJ88037.1 hypothetical protein A1O1_04964 [Capronia coronata CBS 617.96]